MKELLVATVCLVIGIAVTAYAHGTGGRSECEARNAQRIGGVLQTYGCAR